MDFSLLDSAVLTAFGERAGGRSVTLADSGLEIDAVFDSRAFEDGLGVAGGSSLSTTIAVRVAETGPVAAEARIAVRGRLYRVKDRRGPDGAGWLVLDLERIA